MLTLAGCAFRKARVSTTIGGRPGRRDRLFQLPWGRKPWRYQAITDFERARTRVREQRSASTGTSDAISRRIAGTRPLRQLHHASRRDSLGSVAESADLQQSDHASEFCRENTTALSEGDYASVAWSGGRRHALRPSTPARESFSSVVAPVAGPSAHTPVTTSPFVCGGSSHLLGLPTAQVQCVARTPRDRDQVG